MSVTVVSPVFIGRREELASLATLLGQAAERVPAFALIGGEAGVGKTRLVRELTGSAAGLGFLVLTGQCVELGAEGLPLAPLVDALRTLSRVMPPDELAGVLGPAGASLARLLPELTPGADGGTRLRIIHRLADARARFELPQAANSNGRCLMRAA